MTRTYLIVLTCFLLSASTIAQTISGELKKWHAVTIEFTDDESYSETGATNPFLDRRLTVTFTSPSNNTYQVPGYFAADGNAAETSATSGNKFHVKFTPDEIGTWSYSASFRQGNDVAITYPSSPTDGSANSPINGQSGNFSISATDKTGLDFRGKGRLEYVDERYMKWAETGDYFLEFGADSPETFLEYADFDNTPSTRTYSTHGSDWNSGDPSWQSGKGTEIIGVVNYLSEQGMNVHYFLTNNILGDGRDAYPYVNDSNFEEFDVSKMAQWDILFGHMMEKGVLPEFVLTENENQSIYENAESVLGGFADSRKLYYREMVARYSYLNAVVWNIGEEIAWNTGGGVRTPLTTQQQKDFAEYLKSLLPVDNQLISIHNGPSTDDSIYNGLLGDPSYNSISYQGNYQTSTYGHDRILNWINASSSAGQKWVVRYTEPYSSGSSPSVSSWRQNSLWASLIAGAAGVQYYDGGGSDLSVQNYSVNDGFWSAMNVANEFFINNDIPFQDMSSADGDISTGWMMSDPEKAYVAYLSNGNSNPTVDFGSSGNTFTLKWYDPRNGGSLQNGSITSITSNGSPQNIGLPPNSTTSDWVLYAYADAVASCSADYEESNGLVVIEAENIDLVAGWSVENGSSGYTGTGYINWTGGEYFSTPGNGTITATIQINTPGTYLFEWRSKIGAGSSATDNNDTWVRFNDASEYYAVRGGNVIYPQGSGQTPTVNGAGGGNWFKVYTNSIPWSWQTRTNDNLPYDIYVDFDSPGVYTMEISGRSENHFIDRIVLSASGNEDLGLPETTCEGGDPTASISIDDITIEEGGNAVLTVSLDNAVSGGFSVDYATANNTALSGSDYNANNGTLNFSGTAGETETISISTIDDAAVESDEEFFVNLSNATNGVIITDNQGVVTLTDNDVLPGLTIDNVTVTEGGDAIFTVTLDNPTSPAFDVDYSTSDLSAASGEDYTASSGTLNFAGTAGETHIITISTLENSVLEPTEQFEVNITTSSSVTILDGQGLGTINDDDTADLSINNASGTEGNNLVFTVTLDNAVSENFTVDFSTASNSATSGTDFTANSGTLNFTGTVGETQTITVNTSDDAILEGTESFYLDLSNATSGVSFSDAQGLGSITDNDSASVSISDVSVSEGNSAVLVVTLDNAVSNGFSLDFASSGNTATEGVDFTANSGSLNFVGTVGETQSITINTTDDSIVEADEDFFVNLSNASDGVSISDAQGLATITDNDNASITINNTTVTEGSTAVLTVSVDNAVDGGFSVDFSSAGNTAIQGVDFSATSGVLNFAGNAGETQTINVNTINDAAIEGTESFFINLSNATNGIGIADNQSVITLVDDDSANIFVSDSSIEEGGILVFDISLSSAVGGGFSVDFSTAGNTATAGSDYTSNSGTINFIGNAGETQTISVTTLEDALVEGSESFFVNLTNATNGVTIADGQGIGTITDNDNASVTINNTSIGEGGTAVLTVTLDNTVSGGFNVDYSTAGNSATQGADFTANSGTLNFTGTAGETQTISVQTIDDVVLENSETFYVDLSNATNGVGIADPQGLVSITDNDSASIAIGDTVVTEGNSAVVNVTLTNAVSGGFSVDYSTQGSSAIAAIDFVVNSGTLNFNGTSGESQSITIATNDDSIVENTESFFVNLSGATNGVNISDDQAVVTITDNDSEPAAANISIDDVQINEGENIVFTVTLDADVSGGFTVNYTTSDVSAVEGQDFVGVNGSLIFSGVAGETQNIVLISLDDTEIEATETFSVLLSNATNNVNILDPQGTASILDNDSESEEPVEITITDGEAQEGGSIIFEVLLSRELPEDLLLYYEVVNESASAEDYDLDVNSVLIRAGETSGQIVVTVLSDTVVEEDETFSIRLLDPANTVVRLADDIAVGTIIDSNSQEEEDIILYPVPLKNGSDLTVSRIVDGDYFMSLYTYTGQLIYQDQITVANNSYEIDLEDSLATGIFLLELTNVSAGIQYEKLFVISR